MHVSGQWCQYSKTFPPAHREGDSAARSWGRVKEQGPCPLGHHLCPSVTSSSLSTGPGSLTARGTLGTRLLTPTPPQTWKPVLEDPNRDLQQAWIRHWIHKIEPFQIISKCTEGFVYKLPVKLYNYSLHLASPDLTDLDGGGEAVTGLTMGH